MKHSATAAFWRHYEALPADIQKLADKNFDLLKLDPGHPSLHFKLIRDDLWSARIGMRYRALALKQETGFGWFWIGSHAEYDRLVN
ncbi:MAG: hypothetical protein ACKVS5_03205 [Parvularculaceae bacterium]